MAMKMKKLLIPVLSVMLVFSAFFAVKTVASAGVSVNDAEIPAFYMDGAAIRKTGDHTGIRFAWKMEESEYDKLQVLKNDFTVTTGTVVIPENLLNCKGNVHI